MVAGALLYPVTQLGTHRRRRPAIYREQSLGHGRFRSRLKTELFNRAYYAASLSKQDFSRVACVTVSYYKFSAL